MFQLKAPLWVVAKEKFLLFQNRMRICFVVSEKLTRKSERHFLECPEKAFLVMGLINVHEWNFINPINISSSLMHFKINQNAQNFLLRFRTTEEKKMFIACTFHRTFYVLLIQVYLLFSTGYLFERRRYMHCW